MHNQNRKLPTRAVCARYSVVARSVERWLDRPELDFPKPTFINKRRYWDAAELDAWDRRCAAQTASGQSPRKKMPPRKAAPEEATAA